MEVCPCNMEKEYKNTAITSKDVATGSMKVKTDAPVVNSTPEKKMRKFYFPTKQMTIVAETMQEALKKLEELTKNE